MLILPLSSGNWKSPTSLFVLRFLRKTIEFVSYLVSCRADWRKYRNHPFRGVSPETAVMEVNIIIPSRDDLGNPYLYLAGTMVSPSAWAGARTTIGLLHAGSAPFIACYEPPRVEIDREIEVHAVQQGHLLSYLDLNEFHVIAYADDHCFESFLKNPEQITSYDSFQTKIRMKPTAADEFPEIRMCEVLSITKPAARFLANQDSSGQPTWIEQMLLH